LTSKDSIVADNTSAIGANCSAVATSHGHNLENGTTCGFTGTGDLNTEPHLGLLKDNGGLTPTQMPLAGSPAINHGETSGCAATDQRGVIRPQGPACDIGAYELAPPAAFTGGATIGHSAHVSLAGTGSNPDVVAGAVSFQWGKTTSYGKQSSTQALPVAASHMPFTISVGQLAAGTLYHYRAVAMNGDGAAYGADATFKTPNAPSLTKLVVRPHKFRPGSGAKHGASISYIDTQPALTTFTVLRASRGYKVGGSCRAHKPKGHKKIVRCTRYSKLGRFSHQDVSGTNRLHFTGLVKGKALAAGKYRLKAQARNGFGALSSAVLKSFRIF
jgi:hypothetical protein